MGLISNDDGSVTVTLSDVVTIGSNEISEVCIKKPKGKHLRGVDLSTLGEYDVLSKVVVGCSDLNSTAEFDEFDATDVMECFKVVSDFLGGSPETGKTA